MIGFQRQVPRDKRIAGTDQLRIIREGSHNNQVEGHHADQGEKPDQDYLYSADKKLLSLTEKCSIDSVCRFGTGDIFLADKELKNKYSSIFDICAFDMETAAIASVCHKTKTPYVSIRKISDDCDETAAESYTDLNEKKEIHLSEVLEELLSEIQENY